ncbi:MAG: sporulation protein YqfC [Clostridia bacterium]|nr:sporulation protein YqfC [Clostridia bacterium]
MDSKKTDNIKALLSEMLELPKDVMLDLPRITMIGNLQMYIENHKGIIEYNLQRARINTSIGIIRIVGRDLSISKIRTDEIIVAGQIENVEFIF